MTQFPPDSSPNPTLPEVAEPAVKWQVQLLRLLTLVLGLAVLRHYKPDLVNAGIAFVITLSVLVFVHEWGHFQFARWAGMKVNRFAIGFPPFIYTKRVKGIDYSIGALPIGGMVDIAGLGSEEEMIATTQGEPLQVAPRNVKARFGEKLFQDAPLRWRFMTLFAGPMMNFIYAFVVFLVIFSIKGKPEIQILASKVTVGAPAAKAGLKDKDRIISVNGQRIVDPEVFINAVRSEGTAPLSVLVDRGGKQIQTTIVPVIKSMDTQDGNKPVPSIGIELGYGKQTFRKLGLAESVQTGAQYTYKIASGIGGILKRALTFRLTKSDKEGVGGPVKIAQVIGETAQSGWADLLIMSAALSVNLGLMNLLPFPALDGGRILFLGYELVARKPIDARKEGFAHTVGMVMLLAFMLFITARDIWPMIQKHLS